MKRFAAVILIASSISHGAATCKDALDACDLALKADAAYAERLVSANDNLKQQVSTLESKLEESSGSTLRDVLIFIGGFAAAILTVKVVGNH